ncbi:MAG: hypothetical protein Q9195_007823 [Heterodermia aff. obscurata]
MDPELDYLYHHVFLPPQLPQHSDVHNGQGDQALLRRLLESVAAMRETDEPANYNPWSTIHGSLRTFSLLHSRTKSLSKDSLKGALRGAEDGDLLILHISLQNSGLIIHKRRVGYVVETFEASPRAANVLAAESGTLEWDFPSRAVILKSETFKSSPLQDSLGEYLEKASLEPVKQYAATTLKAGSNAYESRDTAIPAIVGQLLMDILEAIGTRHTPILTRKRIRDEVCWSDGAENPWRRSPTWLVLRVGIQRALVTIFGDKGIFHYKSFMCLFMSKLCSEFCEEKFFSADKLAFARAKLARRVAKLESQSHSSNLDVPQTIRSMLTRNDRWFTTVLQTIGKRLDEEAVQLRIQHTRKLYRLPKRADAESTVLSLHNSHETLSRILREVSYGHSRVPLQLAPRQAKDKRFSTWMDAQAQDHISTTDYYYLADMEIRLASDIEMAMDSDTESDMVQAMSKLRQSLRVYQHRALRAFRENAEQLSVMLLVLMEQWVAIDRIAVRLYPLLLAYDHGFPCELLYPLKAAKLSDMHRLQKIEQYLEGRRQRAVHPISSILGDPSQTCFAVRYYDQCEDMQGMSSTIWSVNEIEKLHKEEELREKNAEYAKLTREASMTACLYIQDDYDPLKRQHDDKHCRKHYLERSAARVRIELYEDLLPEDEINAKAVVFELLLPPGYADWRDSTWQLLTLARGVTMPDKKPSLLLRDYSGLQRFFSSTSRTGSITLASRTKSFLQTHYSKIPFPAQLDKVCVPHGLKYGLYDSENGLWTSRLLGKPDFANICSPDLPLRSAWTSVQKYLHPTFHGLAPSVNEIVASHTRCPNNLTIAEYTTFQDLRIGTTIQWLKVLRELASSNINFGSVEITTLITELCLGAGPHKDGDPLRAAHWVFRDQTFCRALAAQVGRRVQAIATNWRETQAMECMLVLLQRLWSLGAAEESIEEARKLIILVRTTTHDWIHSLRREICNATEVETAQKRSQECLHAALLCRKTFVIEAATPHIGFGHDAFICFLECAFTIRDNLSSSEPGYIARMPPSLRRLYVSDLRLVHRLEAQIRWSIENLQSAVSGAVTNVWTEGVSARTFSTWTVLPSPQDGWVSATSISNGGNPDQSILFDMFEGTLYIDGQLLGRLPEEFCRQDFFQQFFGNRIFLTRPSYLRGMSYMLTSLFEEHEIHFGNRDGKQFMRVSPRYGLNANAVMEFLPPTTFLDNRAGGAPDLPIPLIHQCVHWLELGSQTVHIRSHLNMWRSRWSDWHINLATRQGIRRTALLVDPHSSIFGHIASLIEPFENRKNMVIFQPQKANITLDLPGLELTFRVGFDGLLASRQLRAFIDSDQDAGTLYGLRSKLVLCDNAIPDNRSILVAMGPATIHKSKSHVAVDVKHNGYYARFTINKLLGRLECAAEPRLIYFKAYCHAITGSVHPDPLIGRTGIDEALSCINSASAQPWASLDNESYRILLSIADLTPARVYYPETIKVLQRVLWLESASVASQNDQFRPIVEDILRQCAALHRFHLDSGSAPMYKRESDPHLLNRAASRNQNYRPIQYPVIPSLAKDDHYQPRDSVKMPGSKDANEAASLVWRWSRNIKVSSDLAARLQEWPLIQGYDCDFDVHLLSSLIDLDPATNWGSLFKLCRQVCGENDKPRLMFLFATVAFGGRIDIVLLRSLIAICIMDKSSDIPLPKGIEFIRFRRSHIPNIEHLAQFIRPHKTPYPGDERDLLAIPMHGKQRRKLELAQKKFEDWPSHKLFVENLPDLSLLNVDGALSAVTQEWERLADNYQLSEHLKCVQDLLDHCRSPVRPEQRSEAKTTQEWYRSYYKAANIRPDIYDLLCRPLAAPSNGDESKYINTGTDRAQIATKALIRSSDIVKEGHSSANQTSLTKQPSQPHAPSKWPNIAAELQGIINGFSSRKDPVRAAYGRDLNASLSALRHVPSKLSNSLAKLNPTIDTSMLNQALSSAQAELQTNFNTLQRLAVKDYRWLQLGGLLPDITPVTLLGALGNKMSGAVRAHAISYAKSIVSLQHLLRIQAAYRRSDTIQLASEAASVAHVGWQVEDHLDWLLLEIDFNLIIREDQLQVAQAMIASPSRTSNFVLQMNMGQGKSSVVIPMVATALASDRNLVRVVVPRSLLLQAAQLLTSRLGGLINRRVKHIPFSRKTKTDIASIKAYHYLHLDTFSGGGIILTLPEHLLSFQLSGLQELSNGHVSESNYMIKLQSWFSRKARDILDECDHMLAVKTQLIYPSGAQSPVDGHPNRWRLVQTLLKLVKTHVKQLQREFPRRLEVINRCAGAFPTTYFLDQHIKDVFIEQLTTSVLRGEGGLIPIQECSKEDLALADSFLRHAQIPKAQALKIANVFKDEKDARQQILLLRGLLVHKILLMGLGKRWNVQYGIHPLRDPIAVPFRSKGIPSDQSEFGHPDVSILLTCLSFYNSGINLAQFRQTLGLLMKLDEPIREFELWVSEVARFPESLRSYNSINIDDETQCIALWNHLRLQMTVINFFLNHFVFPRHAKTFNRKLVSSGWDIATPLSATKNIAEKTLKENHAPGTTAKRPVGGVPTALTVGFSGTNDNRTLLPLNIVQNDLPGLSHTSAEVLSYLLQPRNRRYIPAWDERGRRLSERALLRKLKDHGIRMLLDAGAQILELDNISLAITWLEVDPEPEAAVFFGEDERARVVYRDRKVQPLAASPYHDNLGACVVYLDEAHTRGVDLKMPAGAVAALTLGVMQTKDHTVQAAMRLRQLGVSHVEQLQPLYVSQGMDFCRRRIAAQKYDDAAYHADHSKEYLEVLEQPEKYSLEELYAPDRKIKAPLINTKGNPEITKYVQRLNVLKTEVRSTGDTVQALAHQEVEQEREVAIEVETVREMKKPRHAQASSQPPLHTDVQSFADTGVLAAGSLQYIQAFVILRQTAVGRRLGVSDGATRSKLYVTQDFSKTVIPDSSTLPRDEYSRPVHWLLWSTVTRTALIVSDFEANALLPLLRDSLQPIVHLLTYAAPVIKSMIIFDDLDFYAVPKLPDNWQAPRWLVRDLGIFAGRTYFDYDKQYFPVCEALGLPVPESRSKDLDREMPFPSRDVLLEPFSPAPMLFMQEWIAVRQKGQDFSQTMMGDVCRGRRLDRPEVDEVVGEGAGDGEGEENREVGENEEWDPPDDGEE